MLTIIEKKKKKKISFVSFNKKNKKNKNKNKGGRRRRRRWRQRWRIKLGFHLQKKVLFPRWIGPLDGNSGGLDILQLKSHVRVELVDCSTQQLNQTHTQWNNYNCDRGVAYPSPNGSNPSPTYGAYIDYLRNGWNYYFILKK